jgi:seryl-tRNA(Sec) selenium transferase
MAHEASGQRPGVVPLEEVIDIGKRKETPVLVDAAGEIYPVELLRKYAAMGADLACYSGKYFWAPNSTGFLCGRRDLVEAAALHSFIGFEGSGYPAFGRGMKLDRQDVVALVVALREWVKMDHRARLEGYGPKVRYLLGQLAGIDGVEVGASPERAELPSGISITLDENRLGKTAAQVERALRDGDPSIWVYYHGNTIRVSVEELLEGQEQVLAERLRELLAKP